MKIEDLYTTSDTDLATTLVTLGYSVAKVDKGDVKRVFFSFVKSTQLLKDIQEYESDGLLLQPQRLFNSYKYIKSLIFNKNE